MDRAIKTLAPDDLSPRTSITPTPINANVDGADAQRWGHSQPPPFMMPSSSANSLNAHMPSYGEPILPQEPGSFPYQGMTPNTSMSASSAPLAPNGGYASHEQEHQNGNGLPGYFQPIATESTDPSGYGESAPQHGLRSTGGLERAADSSSTAPQSNHVAASAPSATAEGQEVSADKDENSSGKNSGGREKQSGGAAKASKKRATWFGTSRISSFLTSKLGNKKQAHLGQENSAYFDEKTKRWVFPGEDQNDDDSALPPPPDDDELDGDDDGGNRGGDMLQAAYGQQGGASVPQADVSGLSVASYQADVSHTLGSKEPGGFAPARVPELASGTMSSPPMPGPAPGHQGARVSMSQSSATSNGNRFRAAGGGRRPGRPAYVDTFNPGATASASSAPRPVSMGPSPPSFSSGTGGGSGGVGSRYKIFTPSPVVVQDSSPAEETQGPVVETSWPQGPDELQSSTNAPPVIGEPGGYENPPSLSAAPAVESMSSKMPPRVPAGASSRRSLRP